MDTKQMRKTAATADAGLAAKRAAKAASAAPTADMLAVLTTRANELLLWRAALTQLETQVGECERTIKNLEEVVLPGLMDEAGVPLLGLEDGQVMTRTEEVYASISKANATAAADWLVANGYGSIVRSKITVELEKGDTALLALTRAALSEAHIGFEENAAVNAATLRAFVKERLEAGTVLPDTISVHVQPRVTVKEPKKRQPKETGVR